MGILCPYCRSSKFVKNGKVNGKQTYLCKNCFSRFLVETKNNRYSLEVKRKAISLYKEGYTLTEISKKLNVKIQNVFYWVNS